MAGFSFPAYDGDDLNQDLELTRLNRRLSNPTPALDRVIKRRRKRDITAREVNRRHLSIDHAPDPIAGNGSNPLFAAMQREDQERLGIARRRLPPGADEILNLTYEEQLSNRDIAERLDISQGAVRTRQHRAISKLRKMFTHERGER